jgi:hypothetical protein
MQSSWGANKEPALLYTEEFLRSVFEYPGAGFDLAPAIYTSDGLAAFAAGFPRSSLLDGKHVPLLLFSFLTASLPARHSGYGVMVWGELLRRARSRGYEGAIHLCVEGDEMNAQIGRIARLFQVTAAHVYSAGYVARFLRPATEAPPPLVSDLDVELFVTLSRAIPPVAPLARVWTLEEADWQCRRRTGALTLSAEFGSRRGMLSGYIVDVTTNPPVRTAILDDLLWGSLDPAEQRELLARFMKAAAARGARNISCPLLGYACTQPLDAAGFRRSARTVHIYLTMWNGYIAGPLSSVYLDIF